jgi:spoIIIJ-associated protein
MSDTGITGEIVQFLERFTAAMGIRATAVVEQRTEGPRINLDGDEVEILVRHRGEPLKALQHVVDMAFGRRLPDDQRVFVDALDYRRGKDVELKQTAKLLAEKVKLTGADQQIGPLNPYERRLVHLAVAEVAGVSSESVGDAFSKTVYLSLKK